MTLDAQRKFNDLPEEVQARIIVLREELRLEERATRSKLPKNLALRQKNRLKRLKDREQIARRRTSA